MVGTLKILRVALTAVVMMDGDGDGDVAMMMMMMVAVMMMMMMMAMKICADAFVFDVAFADEDGCCHTNGENTDVDDSNDVHWCCWS